MSVEDVRKVRRLGAVGRHVFRAQIVQDLAAVLLHFFNHQTHHRGQAHCILTRIAGEAPSFDLLIYQRESGISIHKGQGGRFDAPERPGA